MANVEGIQPLRHIHKPFLGAYPTVNK